MKSYETEVTFDGAIAQLETMERILKRRSSPGMTINEAIMALDEKTLIGLVMQLTGGSASPSVVKSQIQKWREIIKDREANPPASASSQPDPA